MHAALAVALLAIPAYNIARHYPEMMDRRQVDVGPQARQVLAEPMPEGAVLAGLWNDITPLRYVQKAEKVRPDVWIVATDAIASAYCGKAPSKRNTRTTACVLLPPACGCCPCRCGTRVVYLTRPTSA